jgi:hypothetical protein
MDWLDKLPPWVAAVVGGLAVVSVPLSKAVRQWHVGRAQAAQIDAATDRESSLFDRLERRLDKCEAAHNECLEKNRLLEDRVSDLERHCRACTGLTGHIA